MSFLDSCQHVEPGFTGCPYNNDFYYNGTVSSPFYPSNYPQDVKCWYYMYAARGNVLRITFTHFDLDASDYVSIYDGYGEIAPLLVQSVQ
jgi:hypothetical protein